MDFTTRMTAMAKRSRPNARANTGARAGANSNERGQMVAMSITDIVNRKTGAVAGPTAAIQDVSSMVAKSLEGLVETKKLASAAEAVKTLMAEDQGPQESPFAGLKEIGINVGDMMQFQAQQAKMAQDELHKTREQILEEKSRGWARARTYRNRHSYAADDGYTKSVF